MAESLSIPIICGPTGAGKTACALALAERHPIEVINADSRQMIRHLDVGTAKPTIDERNKVRFHLVDIVEPGERYSAFRFIDDASAAIDDILGRHRVPVVVGGTGLYLKALSEGVVEIEGDDLTIRAELEEQMEKLGAAAMHDRLSTVDPLEATKIHPHNKVRVLRALELFYLTGKCKSELVATGAYRKPRYQYTYYCLQPPRGLLYERIDRRVEEMLAAGWAAELKTLVERGLNENIRKASVIGYSELLTYLECGESDINACAALIKQSTRRYAKRQMTWFRQQVQCRVLEEAERLVEAVSTELSKTLKS